MARIDKAFRKGLRHMSKAAEVHVVTFTLAGQQRVQRVMEVIVPLRVEAVPAQFGRANHARIIQRALRNDIYSAIQRSALLVHGLGQFFEKVQRRVIENRMDRIQPESIEMAEDRKLFAAMLDKLGLRQTPNGSAVSVEEAVAIANRIGYPVLVRPSFVLGGRAMELVYNDKDLERYMESAIQVSPDRPFTRNEPGQDFPVVTLG